MACSWKSTTIRKEAKSDGANALESTKLRGVLKELLAVQGAIRTAHQPRSHARSRAET